MNLSEFLLSRIAEDEAVARCTCIACGMGWCDGQCPTCQGGDRHPRNTRPLVECEAKRRITELHKIEGRPESVWHDREDGLRQLVKATEYTCSVCGWVGEDGPDGCGTTGCDTLRALALPYADHPDYRQEWKP